MATVNSLGLTYTLSSVNQTTIRRGFKVTANTSSNIVKITKDSGTTATTAWIYSSAATPTILATATFSGNDATFNFAYTSGTSYYIMIGNGTNFTFKYRTGATFPISTTDFSILGDYYTQTPYTTWNTENVQASLVSITTDPGTVTQNSNFLALM